MSRKSWTWRLAIPAGVLVLALALAACNNDSGDSETGATGTGGESEVTLELGYVTTATHPYGIAVDHFVEQVDEASNGEIEIQSRPQYPGGDVPLLEDVKSGKVELATVSTATWSSQDATAFEALQAPFLITNYPLEREVITGDIAREMLDLAEEQVGGIVGLAIHEGGLRQPLGVSEALDSPAAFDGKRLRAVQSRVLELNMDALGARPIPIPLPEVRAALDDGTVAGMEANLGLIQSEEFYEVADFVSKINLWPFPTALVMNKDAYDQLDEGQQEAIREAADTVPGFSIDEIFLQPSDLPQTLCDEGITFVEVSEADAAALRAEAQSAYDELSENETTEDFITRIQELKDDQGEVPAPASPEDCTQAVG